MLKIKTTSIPFSDLIVKLEYPVSPSSVPFNSAVTAIRASSPFRLSVDTRNDPFMDIALASEILQFTDDPLSNLTSLLDFKTVSREDS